MEDSVLSPASLVQLCCETVAENFSSYKYEDIAGLTAPVLDELKFYLKPEVLHDMTTVFEQCGVDASDVWKCHVMTALGRRRCKRTTSVLEPNFPNDDIRHRFIVYRKVCPFHQKYISLHCGKLLEKVFDAEDVDNLPQIYKSLLHLLPSVLYLKMRVKYFIRLTVWEDILTILLRNLETLIITGLNFLVRSNVGVVAMLLKKFCGTKHLKGIMFEDSGLQVSLGCFNELLRTLNDSIVMTLNDSIVLTSTEKHADAENSAEEGGGSQKTEQFNENGNHETTENSLYDVAFSALDETKHDFWEVLKKVHVYQTWKSSDEETMDSREVNCLESLTIISIPDCILLLTPDGCKRALSDSAENHFSLKGSNIRRLNLESCLEVVASTDLIHEVLVMVGCHQLTHLRLSDFKTNNFIQQLLCILGKCYSGKSAKPMELLHLTRIADTETSEEKLPQFENTYEICAVKDVCFETVDLGPTGVLTLRTFLRLNTCLQCLKLESLESTVGPSKLSLVDILDCLMESHSLQTLFLQNFPSIINTGETISNHWTPGLTAAVTKFLNNIPTLKILKLCQCGISEELVTNCDFVEAIQKHPSLTALSLRANMLRSSGAQFLLNLLSTNQHINLKELDISCCGIPGHALYSAAQTLNKITTARPLINRLVISGMVLGSKEIRENELRINFSRLVRIREKENREEQRRLIAEFARLVDDLVADYHGLETADFVANM